MPDLFFTEEGDLRISANGDLALTDTPWRDISQQAYVAMLTQTGDFLLYPSIGVELERLFGMPQSPETGEYGKQIIISALSKMDKFSGLPISVQAIPTGLQSIRFDVYVISAGKTELVLSIEQNLGFE